MENICKTMWTQTPSISCRYQLRTTIQKRECDREKSPIAVMTTEGNVTLPLIIVAGVMILVATPCICRLCCKKRRKQKAD